ncbi:MAG: transporter substrate-binding domain-containing protein [Alphaproteobacteria bacterium]|nr:transporter substrate-binding domain-containing protein [Alphaproteobacteria bacterium]
MTKNLILPLIVALAVSVGAHFFMNTVEVSHNADKVYERIMRTGTIRCGYINWWPAILKDPNSGEMKGYVVDYFNALAKALDLKIEWTEELNLGTYLNDLNNGRYDVECAGGWPSAVRGKLIYYTNPFAYSPAVPFVRVNDTRFDSGISTLSQKGIKAAVVDGDTSQIIRRQHFPAMTEISIPQNAAINEYFVMVASGKADVTFSDYIGALAYIEKNPDTIKPLPYNLRLVPQCVGVPMGENKLLAMLNTANQELLLDGTVESILVKYEPAQKMFVRATDMPPASPTD